MKQSYYFKEDNWQCLSPVRSFEISHQQCSSVILVWCLPGIQGVGFNPQDQNQGEIWRECKRGDSCASLSGLRSLGLEHTLWWGLWSHKWFWPLWYHLMKCANIGNSLAYITLMILFSQPTDYFSVSQVHGCHKIVHRERFCFHLM